VSASQLVAIGSQLGVNWQAIRKPDHVGLMIQSIKSIRVTHLFFCLSKGLF
jgi:hypothetical protein